MQRRQELAACALALVAALAAGMAGTARAQAWPAHPIRLIIPLAAGGATDKAARLIAQRLGDALGQQVVPENITGASGAIALQRLATSKPDGYTLGATANSLHTVAPHMGKLTYDAQADFSMIGTYAGFEYVLITGSASPAANVGELVARARSAPGSVSFGSSGIGTGNHLAGVLLGQLAGVELNSIPYRGGSPAILDVMAGRTDFMFDVLGAALPQIEGGKVRALATSGSSRSRLLPSTPTVSEAVPGYEATGWFALIGPAGLPPAIVQRLNAELNRIQAGSDYRDALTQLGYHVLPGTTAEASARQKTESAKWASVIDKLPCSAVPERCDATGAKR